MARYSKTQTVPDPNEYRTQSIPSNFLIVDEDFVPFTPDEWDFHVRDFLKRDAGNGKYIESGGAWIFENGAILHLTKGRQRGALKNGTKAFDEHWKNYIRFREREIARLQKQYAVRHNELKGRINHLSLYDEEVPAFIEAEIDAVKKEQRIIRKKQRELEALTAPDPKKVKEEQEFRKKDELRKFKGQDRARELLKRLGGNPFGPVEQIAPLPRSDDDDFVQDLIDGNAIVHPMI